MNEHTTALTQLLAATHVVLGSLGRVATEHSLTLGGAHLIVLLPDDGDVQMKTLQAASGNKASTMSSMIDRLEERNLVTRVRSRHDRRSVEVGLTPDGRRIAADIRSALSAEATRLAEAGVDLDGLGSITHRILEIGTT